MSQQQKNSLLTFLDVVRQQVSFRLHRPDWSGFNPTTKAPLFNITNKELWGFGGEKNKEQSLQRSVKRHRHDSWVSRVSCNSDECFPCTDMKFQVHKLSKPLEGLFIAIFGLTNNGPVLFLSHFWVYIWWQWVSQWVWSQLSRREHSTDMPLTDLITPSCRELWWFRLLFKRCCDYNRHHEEAHVFWGLKLLFRGLYLKKNHSKREQRRAIHFIFKRGLSNNHTITKIAQSSIGNTKTLHVTPFKLVPVISKKKRSFAIAGEMGWHALWSVSV